MSRHISVRTVHVARCWREVKHEIINPNSETQEKNTASKCDKWGASVDFPSQDRRVIILPIAPS